MVEFKLAPVLRHNLRDRVPLKTFDYLFVAMLLLVLVALAACAAYVSVINDVTDFDDDMASGKANRLVGKSSAFVATVLASCIIPGNRCGVLFAPRATVDLALPGVLAAFTLYSLSPIRLKNRGGWGCW